VGHLAQTISWTLSSLIPSCQKVWWRLRSGWGSDPIARESDPRFPGDTTELGPSPPPHIHWCWKARFMKILSLKATNRHQRVELGGCPLWFLYITGWCVTWLRLRFIFSAQDTANRHAPRYNSAGWFTIRRYTNFSHPGTLAVMYPSVQLRHWRKQDDLDYVEQSHIWLLPITRLGETDGSRKHIGQRNAEDTGRTVKKRNHHLIRAECRRPTRPNVVGARVSNAQ